jgi:hypothetical protein
MCGLVSRLIATVCDGAETVPEDCQNEVYEFMIVRGKNINANLPLGKPHEQQQKQWRGQQQQRLQQLLHQTLVATAAGDGIASPSLGSLQPRLHISPPA